MISLKKIKENQEKNNFYKWLSHYEKPLYDLYIIFKQNQFKDYEGNNVIEKITFVNFGYFAYLNSSKQLYKYEY